MANQTKTVAPKPKKEVAETIRVEEYNKLKSEMDSLRELILKMSNNSQSTPYEEEEVVLISLFDGTLNLWTQGTGNGQVYKFTRFGEEFAIPLQDAKGILRNQRKFVEKGYFYISDLTKIKDSFVRNAFKKTLDKDSLLNLFDANIKDFKGTYKNLPVGQQKVFADLMLAKLVNKDNIDMNLVSEIEEVSNRDLSAEAENIRQVFKGIEK